MKAELIGPLNAFSKMALDCAFTTGDPQIIAAGPLSKPEGHAAFRIVLVARNADEPTHSHWIVWQQIFPHFPDCGVSHFHHGDYFGESDLVLATKVFAERVSKEAGVLAYLLRDEEKAPPMSDYEFDLIYKDS